MSEDSREREEGRTAESTAELARSFLSALFMGLRTAQVHDPQNAAFGNAIETVRRAAESLYAVTGPFTVQFVEGSTFVNGARLRLDGSLFQTMKKLRELLESRGMGGIALKAPPSDATIRKLVLLFAPEAHQRDAGSRQELESAQVALLGVQRFADARPNLQVDRRVFAVQTYAKLILALKEQRERLRRGETRGTGGASPRLRAVRLVQDLVELAQDRIDFLTKLGLNQSAAAPNLLLAVNGALISVAIGQTLGLRRQDLVSLGVAALFHDVEGNWPDAPREITAPSAPGLSPSHELGRVPSPATLPALRASFGRMLASGDLGLAGLTRAAIVGEQARLGSERFAWGTARPWPHPFARIVSTAIVFSGLHLGVGEELAGPLHPLDALYAMMRDTSGRLDPVLTDALINLLRAYPLTAELLLDSGRHATVLRYTARWDRPVVRVYAEDGDHRELDLSVETEGRFPDRPKCTLRFAGAPALPDATEPPAAPAPRRILAAPELPRTSLLPGALPPDPPTPGPAAEETTLLDASIIPPLDAELGPRAMTADLLPPPSEDDTPPPRVFFVPDEVTEEHSLSQEFEGHTERVAEEVSQLEFDIGGDTGPTTEVEPLPVSVPRYFSEVVGTARLLCGYELDAEIERRDQRRSYAGHDPDDGTEVIVHVMSMQDLPSTGVARDRALLLFEREANVASRISHPALPRLLHSSTEGETRVLVYERPVGTKLRYRLMAGQSFDRRQTRRIIRGIAEGLHHLHERGLVFGALGPETVLTTEEGDVCLGDLSMAAPTDEPLHPRLFEQAYLLSPEFRSGGRFGPRADQYALGGLLYEMLTRKYPRSALTPEAGRLQSPHQIDPSVDPALSAIALRLLDPLPGARFESCEALAMALTRSLREQADP